jgi:hypothetical protein
MGKLKAYLQYQKSKSYESSSLGLGVTPKRLQDFALLNTKTALQASLGAGFTEDKPYVLNSPDDDFSFDSEGTRFVIVFTTERLLNLPPESGQPGSWLSDTISLDDTHNTTAFGFPVVLPIVQDAARASHIIAVVLASHKDEVAYAHICRTLVAARPGWMGCVRNVSADGASAIFNGASTALGVGLIWIMCWMHVYIKNFFVSMKKVPTLAPGAAAKTRARKLARMNLLFKVSHQAQSKEEFEKIGDLWYKSFVENETDPAVKDFGEKMYASWLSRTSPRNQFYAGAAPLRTTNNCGPESINKCYKTGLPFKPSLDVWWDHTKKFLESHSADRRPGYVNRITFATNTIVHANTWIGGSQVAKSGRRWATERGDEDDSWLILPLKYVPDPADENGRHWIEFSYDRRYPGLGNGAPGGAVTAGPDVDVCDRSWSFVVYNKNDTPEVFLSGGGGALTWHESLLRARDVLITGETAAWADWKEAYEYYTKLSIVRFIPAQVAAANPENVTAATFGGYWCQCETCTREKVCSHIVGVRIFLGEVTMPSEYAQFGKQKKRLRGRSRQATGPGMRYGPAEAASDSSTD